MTRNTKSKGEQDAPANDAACKRLSVMLVGGEQNHRSQLQHRLARHCGLVESADSLIRPGNWQRDVISIFW